MLRCALAGAMTLALSAALPASAQEKEQAASCKQQVADAFIKQRSSRAFRMDSELNGQNGLVKITVEYVPPDRMRQKITAPGQPAPLETVLVGTRAWSNQGRSWEELMPAIAYTIIAQVREAVVDPPKVVGEFECLDKVAVDGREYLAYRSIEKPGATPSALEIEGAIHRTIYVDPETGLPAINIVAEENEGATPIFKAVYSYPDDIVIEGYPDAPLAKVR